MRVIKFGSGIFMWIVHIKAIYECKCMLKKNNLVSWVFLVDCMNGILSNETRLSRSLRLVDCSIVPYKSNTWWWYVQTICVCWALSVKHTVEILEILSHPFFVKEMDLLLKKVRHSWFDEFFFSEREFLVFPHCGTYSYSIIKKSSPLTKKPYSLNGLQFWRKHQTSL